MEVIWHILLTVCLGTSCIDQEVARFDNQVECNKTLKEYTTMPADGHWDSINYICKPVGSLSA